MLEPIESLCSPTKQSIAIGRQMNQLTFNRLGQTTDFQGSKQLFTTSTWLPCMRPEKQEYIFSLFYRHIWQMPCFAWRAIAACRCFISLILMGQRDDVKFLVFLWHHNSVYVLELGHNVCCSGLAVVPD